MCPVQTVTHVSGRSRIRFSRAYPQVQLHPAVRSAFTFTASPIVRPVPPGILLQGILGCWLSDHGTDRRQQTFNWSKPPTANGWMDLSGLHVHIRRIRSTLPRGGASAGDWLGATSVNCRARTRHRRCGAGAGRASSRRPRLLPPGPSSLFHRRVRIPLCELVRLVRRTWKFSPGATRAGGRFDHLARSRRHRAKSQATQLLQLGAVRFAG